MIFDPVQDALGLGGFGEVLNIKSQNVALIILSHGPDPKILKRVWAQASIRICADGGANYVYDSIPKEERLKYIPDHIVGDMDSIKFEVLNFYKQYSSVYPAHCKYTTDLEKCEVFIKKLEIDSKNISREDILEDCREVIEKIADDSTPTKYTLVVLGSSRGRLDHLFSIVNSAIKMEAHRKMYLIIDENIVCVIKRGSHEVRCNTSLEGPHCGIIPLAHNPLSVKTEGLEWNLMGNETIGFGALVSTCNLLKTKSTNTPTGLLPETHIVEIETSGDILWTIELNINKIKADKL